MGKEFAPRSRREQIRFFFIEWTSFQKGTKTVLIELFLDFLIGQFSRLFPFKSDKLLWQPLKLHLNNFWG